MPGDAWPMLCGDLRRYIPIFEDEELTPALLCSFRPWPKALHAALDELGVPSSDQPRVVAALSAPTHATALSSSSASPAASQPVAAAGRSRAAATLPLAAAYINLASRTDRRTTLEQALAEADVHAERFEALMGASTPEAEVSTAWDTALNATFDRNTKVQPDLAMSDGERGCAASHLALWRRCIERNGPLLVLEDDLIFSPPAGQSVGSVVRALVAAIDNGLAAAERSLLLYLGADAFVREGAPSLRGQQASWAARASNVPLSLKEARWAWQTHAYVIWPAAARVLLDGLPIDAPVDVYLSRHFHERRLCGLVCEPELCRQLDPYHGGDVMHSSLGERQKLWGDTRR